MGLLSTQYPRGFGFQCKPCYHWSRQEVRLSTGHILRQSDAGLSHRFLCFLLSVRPTEVLSNRILWQYRGHVPRYAVSLRGFVGGGGMGQDEDQAIRDRLKEVEIQQRFDAKRIDGMEKKLWAAIALVLAFVGNKILSLLNLGSGG
jgi:hypothetical protein